MKRILYFFIGFVLCTSCGDFLQEYSQDLVYARSCEDLDEILIGNGYMAQANNSNSFNYTEKDFYYPYLHVMDDDVEEYIAGMADVINIVNPVSMLRNFYIWSKRPFSKVNGLVFRDYDWKRLYQHIGYLNVIIAYVKEFAEDPEDIRHRVSGEALFLRASYYFTLVNLYGNPYSKETAETDMGVPLNTTEYIEEKFFSRDPVATVYRQIVEDLKNAITNLSGIEQISIYRASEVAARALLSRVYLYMGEWQLAIDECDKIIESGCILRDLNSFKLNTSSKSYFNEKSSPEILFTQGSSSMGLLAQDDFLWTTGYRVSDELVELYNKYVEDGIVDLRKSSFFKVASRDKSYYMALKVPMGADATVFDSYILRAAEIYLNKAEAQAMLDQPDAINTIRQLLDKRYADHKLPVIGHLTGLDLVKFIREERRRELCFEGHRWFDLRRYAVVSKYSETKSISHAIFTPPTGASFSSSSIYERSYILDPYGEDHAWVLPIPEEEIVFNEGVMVDNPERKERE